MIEQLSTDIEWSEEIHIRSEDQSGSSVHRFIIIADNFIIFSYFPYVFNIYMCFKNIFGSFPKKIDRFVTNFGFVYIYHHNYRK